MQTETEEQLLDAVIETMTATNPNTMEDTVYLDIEEDGRIIVKASTSAPFSAYAIQRTIHDAQLTMTVDEGTSHSLKSAMDCPRVPLQSMQRASSSFHL